MAFALPILGSIASRVLPAIVSFLASGAVSKAVPIIGNFLSKGASSLAGASDAILPNLIRAVPKIANSFASSTLKERLAKLIGASVGGGTSAVLDSLIKDFKEGVSKKPLDKNIQPYTDDFRLMHHLGTLDHVNRTRGTFSPYNLMYNDVGKDEAKAISRIKAHTEIYKLAQEGLRKETAEKSREGDIERRVREENLPME